MPVPPQGLPGDEVLLPERATESSNTWLQPDGSLRTEVFPTAVNYETSGGAFEPIENELVDSAAPGVAVENAANDYTATLPQDAGSRDVRFGIEGRWVSFRMAGLDGAPVVEGTQATYTNAGDASEVVYEATSVGLKESIVLDVAPSEPVTYEFDLGVSQGLVPTLTPTGAVEVRDGGGEMVFMLPAPFMVDAATPEPAYSTAVSFALTGSAAAGWKLTVTPDQGWLSDPSRVFPVVIDPTVTDTEVVTDCYLNKTAASTSYCAATNNYLKVGLSGSDPRRAILQFGLDELPVNSTTVTSASLKLYLDPGASVVTGSNPTPEYVARRITRDWNGNANWNRATAAATGNMWATPGGDFASSAADGLAIGGGSDGYKTLDATPIVQSWKSGSPNYGLLVKQAPESTQDVLAFYSSGSGDPSRWPKLNITYTDSTPPSAVGAGDRGFYTFVEERLADRISAKVNVGNGNLVVGASDFSVAGVAGLDMGLSRTYNSLLDTDTTGDNSGLGPGWSHNLGGSVRLEFPVGTSNPYRVLFCGPGGYRTRFEKNPAGDYFPVSPGLDGNLRTSGLVTTGTAWEVAWRGKSVYGFDSTGRLKEIRDKQGNHLDLTYRTTTPGSGKLDYVTDTRGRKAVFSYTSAGMLDNVEVRSAAGTMLIRYAYTYTTGTPQRLATSRVDAVAASLIPAGDTVNIGAVTTYGYDANGLLATVKDPREGPAGTAGGTTAFTYQSGSGKVATVTRRTDDAATPDSVTTYTYTTGSVPADCNSEGDHSTLVDGERLTTDVVDTTRYCADVHNRVVRVVDAKGNVRKSTWTADSNVAEYNSDGLGSGGVTTTEFDQNSNPTKISTPTGGVAGASYTDTVNPTLPTAMSDFDVAGNTATPTWNYDYDDKGNLIEAKAAVSAGTGDDIAYRYCWDGDGQLQRIDPIDSAGAQSVSKDDDVNAGCGTASQGNDTIYTYSAAPDRHLVTIDRPGAHRTQTMTYDALSRIKTMTDGRGVRTTYIYDALGHVVSQTSDDDPNDAVTPPTGSATATVTWTYDAAGNQTSMNDPTGQLTFGYDELNRKTSQSQQAPSGNKTFVYDPADNLTQIAVSDEPEPTKYTYDAVNLVTSVDDQRAGVNKVLFDYNKHDKRTKTTFPMADSNPLIQRTKYSADGGQIACVYSYRLNSSPLGSETGDPSCPAASASGLVTYYKYSYKVGGGTSGFDTNTRYSVTEKGNVKTTYSYDAIGRLTNAKTRNGADTKTYRDYTYRYDRHSNMTRETVGGEGAYVAAGKLTMAYDDSEELCWSQQVGAAATPSENGCASAPSGAVTYTHDGAGALAAGSDGLNLGYNVIGQTSSVDPAGAAAAVPMSYAGTMQDWRITKGDLQMSYGFGGLSAQSTNSGQPHAEWFVRDPQGALIAQVDRNGRESDRYYLTDALNSVVALMRSDGVVRRYLYEPFGQEVRPSWIDDTPAANNTGLKATGEEEIAPDSSNELIKPNDSTFEANPYRFASGYFDAETGMLKFGTRFYAPGLGRWTQVDPAAGNPAQPLSMNPYVYVSQNPVNTVDLTGRWGIDLGFDACFVLCIGGGAVFEGYDFSPYVSFGLGIPGIGGGAMVSPDAGHGWEGGASCGAGFFGVNLDQSGGISVGLGTYASTPTCSIMGTYTW